MIANQPQILYMILIVPCLFGFTLVGEGINKLCHEESGGIGSIVFGFLFIGIVIAAYVFFSSFFASSLTV